jgi:hypothetical protein
VEITRPKIWASSVHKRFLRIHHGLMVRGLFNRPDRSANSAVKRRRRRRRRKRSRFEYVFQCRPKVKNAFFTDDEFRVPFAAVCEISAIRLRGPPTCASAKDLKRRVKTAWPEARFLKVSLRLRGELAPMQWGCPAQLAPMR